MLWASWLNLYSYITLLVDVNRFNISTMISFAMANNKSIIFIDVLCGSTSDPVKCIVACCF